MKLSVLTCQYVPVSGDVAENERYGDIMLKFQYKARIYDLTMPVIRIGSAGNFIYEMPQKWADIFGLESGYTKPLSRLMGRAVRGEEIALPVTIEPL